MLSLTQAALTPPGSEEADAAQALRELVHHVEVFRIPSDSSRIRWMLTAAGAFFKAAPYDQAWFWNRAMFAAVQRWSLSMPFDLVHLDTIGLVPYLAATRGTPFILNHHNVESAMTARRAAREDGPLKRLYFERDADKLARFERTFCPRAGQNLVVSELDGERLRAGVGACPTWVVANGVDLEYFSPSLKVEPKPSSLLFVGGMNWYPNRDAVEYFVREIWPILKQKAPETSATFVGRTPPPSLQQSADTRLTAPGFVKEVRPIFERAEIYICPIRDGGGTRLKILDALAMWKPLVSTAMAVEGLGLVDGTHYLRADTADQFVVQIIRLQRDPELRAVLAREGRRLVETRFGWHAIGEELCRAYDSVVRNQADGKGSRAGAKVTGLGSAL